MYKSISIILSAFIVTFISVGCLEAAVNKTGQQQFHAYISRGKNSSENHIKERHWHNANSGPKTSHFSQWMTIEKLDKLANETLNHGKHWVGNNGMVVHQYTFPYQIGTDTNGNKVKSLRVVTDPKRSSAQTLYVITAFSVQ